MSHILCPVDFSPCSIQAIDFAIEVAKRLRSTITLLHVFTEKDYNAIVDQDKLARSFKEKLAVATRRLESLAEEVGARPEAEGIDHCSYRVELGAFSDVMVDLTQNENFDFVVMGTIGASRNRSIFFGGNAEHVIEEIRVPIMLIPSGATYSNFDKIVYASDFSEHDKIAIQRVISFATLFHSRISVLHISHGESDEKYKSLEEELKSFIQYDKISFSKQEVKGSVGASIEQYVLSEKADLLAVFKQDRNLVKSIFHRSLTKTLAYEMNKPLLVFKPAR